MWSRKNVLCRNLLLFCFFAVKLLNFSLGPSLKHVFDERRTPNKTFSRKDFLFLCSQHALIDLGHPKAQNSSPTLAFRPRAVWDPGASKTLKPHNWAHSAQNSLSLNPLSQFLTFTHGWLCTEAFMPWLWESEQAERRAIIRWQSISPFIWVYPGPLWLLGQHNLSSYPGWSWPYILTPKLSDSAQLSQRTSNSREQQRRVSLGWIIQRRKISESTCILILIWFPCFSVFMCDIFCWCEPIQATCAYTWVAPQTW